MMQAMKRRTVLLGVGGLAAMAVSGWAAWRASSRSAPAANRAVGASTELARVSANPLALYGALEGLCIGAEVHLLDDLRPDRQRAALAARAAGAPIGAVAPPVCGRYCPLLL